MHTDRYTVAMRELVSRCRLHRMTDRMSEVEDFSHAMLLGILHDDISLYLAVLASDILIIRSSRGDVRPMLHEPIKKSAIREYRMFDGLCHAIAVVLVRECGEPACIDDDHIRMFECANSIFKVTDVDPNLSPDGRVRLRKHSRGYLYEWDSSIVLVSDESRHIADDPSPERDHDTVPTESLPKKSILKSVEGGAIF